jgi:L-lysine exporter family protein LysE/ArgO
MSVFVEGLGIGLAYAMPIGAQNIFVINASSNTNLRNGLKVAAVVTIMDVTLALACFFGIGQTLELWPALTPVMSAIGSLFLLYIGWGLLHPEESPDSAFGHTSLSTGTLIKTAFILTWFNPQALVDGTMLFGGIRSGLAGFDSSWFMTGAALGSMSWFFTLCTLVCLRGRPLPPKILRIINKCCGVVLIVYGIRLAATGLF